MTVATKKGELLQLRVDKLFLDQLNAIAEEQHMPLSVLLRSWLAERLRAELNTANISRLNWQEKRWEQIKNLIEAEFPPGPIFIIHAFPLSPRSIIDPGKISFIAASLTPLQQSLPAIGRINQYGYEASRKYQDKTISKGQAFKTGQLESINWIDSNGNEILGMALDHGIVLMLQSYINILAGQQIDLPYLFRISFMRIKNYWLSVNQTIFSSIPHVAFQQDFITLQDIVINDFEQVNTQLKLAKHIKPALDELWNASGLEGSASYSDSGEWRERK